MNAKPLHNNILVKQDDREPQSRGSIIVADMGKEKPFQGVVIAVGDGVVAPATGVFIPTTTKVGDRVIFPQMAGSRILIDSEEYVIVKEIDVLVRL